MRSFEIARCGFGWMRGWSPNIWGWQGVLLMGLLCALSACGSRAQDPVWMSVKGAVAKIRTGTEAPVPWEQQQVNIRQAVAEQGSDIPLLMMALPGRNAVATLGLVQNENGLETWADASGITITLEQGVVRETRGLGQDIIASDISGVVAALQAKGVRQYKRTFRMLDAEGGLLRRTVDCTMQDQDGLHIERCAGNVVFENQYMRFSSSGSRQWLGPELGHLHIERLQ